MSVVSLFRFARPVACALTLAPSVVHAENSPQPTPATVILAHKLKPGQTLRYEVTQVAKTKTRMNGSEEIANVHTTSVRSWRVTAAKPGEMTFDHMIESVAMMQQTGEKDEIRWDSRKGETPPKMFQIVASQIGSPLATVTINAQGEEINRVDHGGTKASLGTGQLTLSLPDGPIAIGGDWSVPSEIRVRSDDGLVKIIKIRQRYQLEKVVAGVAVISIRSEPMTAIDSESVKSQVVQQLSNGTLRFDIDNGHLISRELNWDETVVGFQGTGSMMEYRARLTEELLPAGSEPKNPAAVPTQAAAPANAKR